MLRLVAAAVLALSAAQSGCVFYLNPLCTDHISNGDETDIDCGGTCGRCDIGASCKVNADCDDSTCERGTCTAFPCFNGVQDGDETDIDCGGACRSCSGGRACAQDVDCASTVCEADLTCRGLRSVSFAGVTYEAGAKPYAIFAGDLDGDGDIDLASADEINSQLVIALNDGAGAFAPQPTTFTTGEFPTGGAIGDFNHDGVPDVITADYHGDSVSVMSNLGAGILAPRASYPTLDGAETSNLAIGDLNGDGNLDVIATNPMKASVSVFLGLPDGTLGPATDLPVGITGAAQPYSAAIADFDGDGRPDVAIADSLTATIIVRLGLGNGTFQPEIAYPDRGTPPLILITADLNGDLLPDLACANRGSDNVSVLLGRGDGSFRKAILADAGRATGPYSLAVGDLNRDGVPDIVTADYTVTPDLQFSSASVLIGLGNGTFEPPIKVPGSPSYGVTIADFSGDGLPDFAAANYADHTVTVQRNTSQ